MAGEDNKMRERVIKLKLSDDDAGALYEKAGRSGLTVEGLLEAFIADLICGERSGGSDERMYADMWFDRAFPLGSNTFTSWALCYGEDIDYIINIWKNVNEEEKLLQDGFYDGDEEEKNAKFADLQYWKNDLRDLYGRYKESVGDSAAGMETELQRMDAWKEGLERFMKEGT